MDHADIQGVFGLNFISCLVAFFQLIVRKNQHLLEMHYFLSIQ